MSSDNSQAAAGGGGLKRAPLRVLTLTTLYPNAAAPSHGIFVENRLRAFAARSGAEIRVIAPVPWFPFAASWAGRYAVFARAPQIETRHGIEISHPRYVIPPKIGMTYAAHALERCFLKAARELTREGWDFDIIDAHYLYPDGVAAARVARALGKPVVLTARGTDVSLIPGYPRQREMILDAVRRADAVVTVAEALRAELIRLGAPAEKILTLRNGVDAKLFRPLDQTEARRNLGLGAGPVIASVGHLIERKGHHLVIDALASLPGATLLIAGEGPERHALERRANAAGLAARVRFLGAVAHESLAEVYSAADALALASSREGWPNVLLEAMACGTQAVASPVWGASEVISAPAAGRLAETRSADAMAKALADALDDPPSRNETRAFAERHSWNETADALSLKFRDIVARRRAASHIVSRPLRPAGDRPRLIVTVDTEESFDWARFEAGAHRIESPVGASCFQTMAGGFGIRPLYFLTSAVIADGRQAAFFRTLLDSRAADLGIHMHQWETPPLGGFAGEYYSWQCNLPPDSLSAKLETIAHAFLRAFATPPRAHRAGRYGIALADYAHLARLGIAFDFSPCPGFDFSPAGGPDFSAMSCAPFAVEVDPSSAVFVTPLSTGVAMRGTRRFFSMRTISPGFASSSSVRRRPVFGARMRLTCEGTRLEDLIALTRRLVADGVSVLSFSLHSTSLTAGGSPYAPDEAAVAANLDLCQRYFEAFRRDFGGEFIGLDELSRLYDAPQLNLNQPLIRSA